MKKIILLMVLVFVLSGTTAMAHKVIVFAWVEQGRIHIEGSFGSERHAKKCDIKVTDSRGILVHQGITDSLGRYSFKLTDTLDSELMVELTAGPGHSGRWTIAKEELVFESSPEKLDEKMAEKASLEKSPSLVRIAAGIALIFGLAFAAAWLKKRKKGTGNA